MGEGAPAPGRGRFITLEGGEGAGKTTQLQRLAARMTAKGRDVVTTREPGGVPEAEAIRDLLVRGTSDRWTPAAEAMLLYAARAEHLDRLIRPALAAGRDVLCDRFFDSTRAYQGHAMGLSLAFIASLEQAIVGPTRPDLTLILDLPPEIGLERAIAAGAARGETRYERMGLFFHERLREAFLALAAAEPARCTLIDGRGTPDAVAAAIARAVAARWPDLR